MSKPLSPSDTTACSINNRKIIAARFTIGFSFFIALFFTLYNFYDNNERLFHLDSSLLIALMISALLARKKSIFFLASSLMALMIIALIILVYINKGQDGVMYWGYIAIFLFMTSLGHKKGVVMSSLIFGIFFIMAFFWIGESFTNQAYVRYVVSSIILISIAFFNEYSISKVINKLGQVNLSLQELSRIDGLTGLYNRRYFDEVFINFLNLSKREKHLVAFAIVDLDHFKGFNDRYGHQTGDRILKLVSNIFKQEMQRPNDYIFRLGGEEFGILFTTKSTEKAFQKMQEILKEIKAIDIADKADKKTSYITASIGLYIEHYNNNNSTDILYKNSDDALYQAKRIGRDQVVLFNA